MTQNKVESAFIAVDFFLCHKERQNSGKCLLLGICEGGGMSCEGSDIKQPFVLKTTDCSFAPSFEAALSWEIGTDFKEAAEENGISLMSYDKSGVEWCHSKCLPYV
jgi:hypothetical protein